MSESEIYEFLATRYKISVSQVKQAVNSQFKFTSKQMATDNLPAIRIPYFGIFKPNKKKLNKIIQIQNDKKRKQQSENS